MTMTADELRPFTSLRALQQASDQLIQGLPDDGEPVSDLDTEESAERIRRFINQAVATGSVLDAPADRKAAQALIDFWVAKSYAVARDSGGKRRRSARVEIVLRSFSPATVESAIKHGDAVLASLDGKGKDLARRLLFRLLRFPDSGDDFASTPASRDELRKLGKMEQVDKLVEDLRAAGILGITDADGTVALSYLALTRRWEWLADEIKKRMSFRNLALSWIGSGRSAGALLSWPLTWRFREYGNLNDWEQEFVNKSGRYGAAKVAAGIVVAGVLVGGSLKSTSLYADWYAPGRRDSITREILDKEAPIAGKIDAIKWLATYRQRIEIPGVVLNSPESKDLSGIAASGAIFKGAELTAVQFTGATLGGASFNGSIIDQTNFARAYLYRAIFDGAELCENVNFSGADVLYASFKRVKFSDENVPIFAQAAWWQAYGWNFDEIALLDRHYPKVGIKDSEKFQKELARIQSGLEQEKNPVRRAEILNEKAWTLAIYGAVSDGAAKSAAEQALELIKDGDNAALKANVEDTLAYILMQQDDPTRKNLEDAVALLANSATRGEGEVLFRYAVALHASGKPDKEQEITDNLESALLEKQYDPSHELYMLNRYITGDFKKSIMTMTGRTRRLAPTRCPSNVSNPGPKAEYAPSTARFTARDRDRRH